MGCRFCGAGNYFVRNLTAREIVSQARHILENRFGVHAPSPATPLVIRMLSMGEPLLNNSVWSALRTLSMLYPHATLLVSTSAPDIDWSWVFDMGREIPGIELQFSVHESTNPARNNIMPFKRKLSLEQIAEKGNIWYRTTGRKPSFNYCVHRANVSENDAHTLRQLFDPSIWTATVSMIFERTLDAQSDTLNNSDLANDFSEKLARQGFLVRLANAVDWDAMGGECGQLWSFQQWAMEHPELARRSAGNRLSAA
jgi:23S rRNA (adenine2503-C2)-methyltransferase